MAHIVVDNDSRCTCTQADKCVIMHKSGSMPRCTSVELKEAGFEVFRPIITTVRSWLGIKKKLCSWENTGRLHNIERRDLNI